MNYTDLRACRRLREQIMLQICNALNLLSTVEELPTFVLSLSPPFSSPLPYSAVTPSLCPIPRFSSSLSIRSALYFVPGVRRHRFVVGRTEMHSLPKLCRISTIMVISERKNYHTVYIRTTAYLSYDSVF